MTHSSKIIVTVALWVSPILRIFGYVPQVDFGRGNPANVRFPSLKIVRDN